jgi:hypothetical protein
MGATGEVSAGQFNCHGAGYIFAVPGIDDLCLSYENPREGFDQPA